MEQRYRRVGCRGQVRPFSQAAGVKCRGYSLGLQRATTDFGADEGFAAGVSKLKEHYGIEVPISAVRAMTLAHAEAMRVEQEAEVGQLPVGGIKQVVAEMDGSMVPIVTVAEASATPAGDGRKRRQVGWKEARLSLARAGGKVRGHYRATLGSVQEAGQQLVTCVEAVGGGQNTQVHCVGDGASWIVEQVKTQFGEQGHYLVDFYHVSEYLAAAAPVIAGHDTAAWIHQQQQRLKQNRLSDVLAELATARPSQASESENEPVPQCEQYLRNRQDHLDYQGALLAGLPIGSGEVESGHRWIIQKRLKLSGAWWRVDNAEKMLALRTERASGQWSAYWLRACQAAS